MILSELMSGGSLEARFEAMSNGALNRSIHGSFRGVSVPTWKPPVNLAMRWISDLSKAIAFLHSCNIIHRGTPLISTHDDALLPHLSTEAETLLTGWQI